MRLVLLAIVLGSLGARAAAAQDQALGDPASDLAGAAFAPGSAARFAATEGYALGAGSAAWRSGEVRLPRGRDEGPVDTLLVRIGGTPRASGGWPFGLDRAEDRAMDVTLVRTWPKAVSFSSDGLDFDVAPHAGFGVSTHGGHAEGGATVTVSKSREDRAVERLKDMGVKDGASFGGAGRWYLFAAASGRAVGLNMLREAHGWDRAGWSTDPTGALVGDAQVGVGWRRGDMQSSFGVVHREVKGQHMIFGQQTRDDTVGAFTFSLRPR